MVVRKLWIAYKKMPDRWGDKKKTFRVDRYGYFLFGVIPIYVKDMGITEI